MPAPASPTIQRRAPKMAAPDGRKRPMAGGGAPIPAEAPTARPGGAADLTAARADKARQEAIRAARINDHEAGLLLPVEAVRREWLDICASIRSALLAVPARVAAAHPGHPAIVEAIRAEIEAALHRVAEDEL